MSVPGRGVPIPVKLDQVVAVRVEGDIEEVLEEDGAVDGRHGLAQSPPSSTHVPLHVVYSVGHGVNGVHHEPQLGVLFVVTGEVFLSCVTYQ